MGSAFCAWLKLDILQLQYFLATAIQHQIYTVDFMYSYIPPRWGCKREPHMCGDGDNATEVTLAWVWYFTHLFSFTDLCSLINFMSFFLGWHRNDFLVRKATCCCSFLWQIVSFLALGVLSTKEIRVTVLSGAWVRQNVNLEDFVVEFVVNVCWKRRRRVRVYEKLPKHVLKLTFAWCDKLCYKFVWVWLTRLRMMSLTLNGIHL